MAEVVATLGFVVNAAQLTQWGIQFMISFRKYVQNTQPAEEIEEKRRHLHSILDELNVKAARLWWQASYKIGWADASSKNGACIFS